MAGGHFGSVLLELVVILIAAKIGGFISEKIRQPAVLGEMILGVIVGPSVLGWIPADPGEIVLFLAELGIIVLLFDVGLESNIFQLLKVGVPAVLVAVIGVVTPIALGYGLFSLYGNSALISLFVGVTLAATSVGVTMRVLSDMGKIDTKEGKIILGAAVIDDILALILLSVMGGIAATGSVSFFDVGKTSVLSVLFLVVTISLGIYFAPRVYHIVHKLKAKRTFIVSAFTFAIVLAFFADLIGLAAIVGAFAAGLVLETTQHKEHVRERVGPMIELFAPVFFVMAGVALDVTTLFNTSVLFVIAITTGIAIFGKLISGLGAHGTGASTLAIGVGMVPRGEVGLIFIAFGLANGIIGNDLYSMLAAVIILTTFVCPPWLDFLMRRMQTSS